MISSTWWSPWLPYSPDFSFSRCASSTTSASNTFACVSVNAPDPTNRLTISRLRHRPRELRLEHVARRGILRHVLRDQPPGRQRHQQVDRHHRLARSRPAVHDHDLLLARRRGLPRDRQRRLVDDLLVVHQHEFLLASQHPAQAPTSPFDGRIRPLLDPVQILPLVAVPDVLRDELPQPHPLGLALQEHRRPRQVLRVERIRRAPRPRVVVQVRAGPQLEFALVHGFVEVPQQRRIRPRLVGRMTGVRLTSCEPGAHDPVPVRLLAPSPTA